MAALAARKLKCSLAHCSSCAGVGPSFEELGHLSTTSRANAVKPTGGPTKTTLRPLANSLSIKGPTAVPAKTLGEIMSAFQKPATTTASSFAVGDIAISSALLRIAMHCFGLGLLPVSRRRLQPLPVL